MSRIASTALECVFFPLKFPSYLASNTETAINNERTFKIGSQIIHFANLNLSFPNAIHANPMPIPQETGKVKTDRNAMIVAGLDVEPGASNIMTDKAAGSKERTPVAPKTIVMIIR